MELSSDYLDLVPEYVKMIFKKFSNLENCLVISSFWQCSQFIGGSYLLFIYLFSF